MGIVGGVGPFIISAKNFFSAYLNFDWEWKSKLCVCGDGSGLILRLVVGEWIRGIIDLGLILDLWTYIG